MTMTMNTSFRLTLSLIFSVAFGFGCDIGDKNLGEDGDEDTSGDSCEDLPIYVSGTVTREMTETTWNQPFVPTPEVHVRMRLYTFYYDGPLTVLAERDVPFVELPFEFELCADPDAVEAAREGVLAVDVNVYNHAGDSPRVGDLVSEYQNEIDGPTSDLEILVSGVEHCDDPNAGGLCSNAE
jgi:hypothetical protein